MVLRHTRSWLGHEDLGLYDRLLRELPGILLWALAGLKRLRARGRFIQPASAAPAIAELEDLGSPISAFIRDRCETGPMKTVLVDKLFAAWRKWCHTQGRDQAGTLALFARDLRAALPTLRIRQIRQGKDRVRQYEGIGLSRNVTRDHVLYAGKKSILYRENNNGADRVTSRDIHTHRANGQGLRGER